MEHGAALVVDQLEAPALRADHFAEGSAADVGHRLKQANLHSGEPQTGRSTEWPGLAEQRSWEPNDDNNVVPQLGTGSSLSIFH